MVKISTITWDYHGALNNHGLTSSEKWICYGNSSILGGKETVCKILKSGEDIDGIFSSNDLLAIGALKEVQKRGYRVPDQIKIIEVDNTLFAEITTPELSSVSQPIDEMAQKAVELIIEAVNNPSMCKQRIQITPELVIRQSSTK